MSVMLPAFAGAALGLASDWLYESGRRRLAVLVFAALAAAPAAYFVCGVRANVQAESPCHTPPE